MKARSDVLESLLEPRNEVWFNMAPRGV